VPSIAAVQPVHVATWIEASTRGCRALGQDSFEEILRAERDARRARAVEMFARVGGLPIVKRLDGFDFLLARNTGREAEAGPVRFSEGQPKGESD